MGGEVVYLGVGSNLGDRAAHLRFAIEEAGRLPCTRVLAVSTVIETAPIGPIGQGDYLNGVIAIETELPPRALLEGLQAIERRCGRERASEVRWGPRTLDLDILVYADREIKEPGLTIPHPRLHERRFVLAPLAEIAPGLELPGTRRPAAGLLAALGERGDGGSA